MIRLEVILEKSYKSKEKLIDSQMHWMHEQLNKLVKQFSLIKNEDKSSG